MNPSGKWRKIETKNPAIRPVAPQFKTRMQRARPLSLFLSGCSVLPETGSDTHGLSISCDTFCHRMLTDADALAPPQYPDGKMPRPHGRLLPLKTHQSSCWPPEAEARSDVIQKGAGQGELRIMSSSSHHERRLLLDRLCA